MTTAELAKLPYFERIMNNYNSRSSSGNIALNLAKNDNINNSGSIQQNITRTR